MNPPEETPQLTLTRLSDVLPERVEWLWQGRLPVGKIATLDGDPGLGKSTLALNIAATVTVGGPWPDGGRCRLAGDVLLLSAEDGLADTVRPRLDAADADVTRVHAIEGKSYFDPDTGQRYLRPLTLADVADLDDAMAQTSARLLVVDVLMAFLPAGTDSHKDQDIRRVLSALAAAGGRHECTVLLLRHLNKAKGGDPLYRGGGSIGIVGAARSGLLVAADPDDPTRRVLASVKSNLGVMPDSLAYRLVDSPDHGVARVVWEGSTGHDAHGLLAGPSPDDDAGERTAAEHWLQDYLTEHGPTASKVVKVEAAKEKISERTLQRAKKNIGVVDESSGFPRISTWRLPSRATNSQATVSHGATAATGPDQHKPVGATGGATDGSTSRATVCTAGATGPSPASMPAHGSHPALVTSGRQRALGKLRCRCGRPAKVRDDTGLCDFCTGHQQRTAQGTAKP